MKKLFQDFIAWLYKRYVSPDVSDLTKDYFGLVHDVINLDVMERGDRLGFLSDCHDIFNNPAFGRVVKSLTESQKNSTMSSAETELHLICGKMSVYGVQSVYNEIRKYNKHYEVERESVEEFDPHAVI